MKTNPMTTIDSAKATTTASKASALPLVGDEIQETKKLLLQAEVRLARARASAAGAEIDVRVLNNRLRSMTR
jgi:hypothetical protein